MKKADTLRELPGRFIALCTAAFALCLLAASVSALRGVSAKNALGLALSLAAWWVLSKIPFVNRHLI